MMIGQIEDTKKGDELEYLNILKGLAELPFNVGKNLLVDFIKGDYKNKSIINNKLDELNHFASLKWDKDSIQNEVNKLVKNGMIEATNGDYNKFAKLLRITNKGLMEINNPTLPGVQLKNKINFKIAEITNEDKEVFKELGIFLKKFNDEQKKAIISQAKKILCVAGAGSGKTLVLTKRIEFMVKYRNIPPEKILAITFTRKARQEMERRLREFGVGSVKVHTFNSFCEDVLKKYGQSIYGRNVRVQSYGDKILAMNMALGNIGVGMTDAVHNYFTPQQRRLKTDGQLFNDFMNDCFLVMEYFKFTNRKIYDFSKNADSENRENAYMIYQIIKYLEEHMNIQGLRDFTDQIIDALNFLKKNPEKVPQFDYVLIDEYQDVNAMQIELLKIINPDNLFAVGDPRQSIFGWRGSDVNYILNFEKDYSDAEVIHLVKNYRSAKNIVDFMNHSVSNMGLPELDCHRYKNPSEIIISDFESEQAERTFVLEKILSSDISPGEIFVLARTNRQLFELSKMMKQHKIPHIVKTDELKKPVEGNDDEVTLATIHAIKGLEAKKVFVIGCNEQNFPCKSSDHPAVEFVKTDNYDKEEEERRLFYVAVSRAKDILHLTYSGKKPTYFITEKMKGLSVQ